MKELQIISDSLFTSFGKKVKVSVKKCFQELDSREFTVDDFRNYMLAGAVASSQIEGSTLDLNSFYQSKQNKTNKKEVKEIENLLTSYQYAKQNRLSQTALLKCHEILTSTFTNITKSQRGKYRQTMVGIRGWSGLVYLAVEPQFVKQEMEKLFDDINFLLKQKLTLKQTLYYAAFIHFVFAKIHPFADGNSRAARLLEKWFMAEVLGNGAWGIPSEKYYYDKRQEYYNGLNIGVNYHETMERLNQVLPFLTLPPKAVCYKPID